MVASRLLGHARSSTARFRLFARRGFQDANAPAAPSDLYARCNANVSRRARCRTPQVFTGWGNTPPDAFTYGARARINPCIVRMLLQRPSRTATTTDYRMSIETRQ